jgi:hypothetical protein
VRLFCLELKQAPVKISIYDTTLRDEPGESVASPQMINKSLELDEWAFRY